MEPTEQGDPYEPIRLGILGPGRIVERVMRDYPNMRGVRLSAVASRSRERAEAAAKRYGARYAFEGYDALAGCDEVDLAYVATPHNFHREQAIALMERGKHILCEKPMAVNAGETRDMVRCAKANGVFLMEAMWTRFFPAAYRLRELLAEGAIGAVRHVYADFAASGPFDPKSRAYDPEVAGGSLLDLGVYPLMATTMALGWEPERVQGFARLAPTGVDARACAQMLYPSGATAQWLSAFDASGESREIVYGEAGHIVVPDFWRPTSFTVYRDGEDPKPYRFPDEAEGHCHEFTHAAECIREGRLESPIVPWAESIAVSGILDRVRESIGLRYPFEALS